MQSSGVVDVTGGWTSVPHWDECCCLSSNAPWRDTRDNWAVLLKKKKMGVCPQRSLHGAALSPGQQLDLVIKSQNTASVSPTLWFSWMLQWQASRWAPPLRSVWGLRELGSPVKVIIEVTSIVHTLTPETTDFSVWHNEMSKVISY